MKNLFKTVLFLLPFTILFSSCVEITRNIVINKDGSGTEAMTVNFSRDFFKMMQELASLDTTKKKNVYDDSKIISDITGDFEGNGLIKNLNVSSVMNQDSSKTLSVNYNFSELTAIALDDEVDNALQVYMKEQGDTVKFYYELTNQPANNDTTNTSMSDLTSKLFEGKLFTLNIEFPYDVISSNATAGDGRKLTWIMPMNMITKQGSKQIFEAELKK